MKHTACLVRKIISNGFTPFLQFSSTSFGYSSDKNNSSKIEVSQAEVQRIKRIFANVNLNDIEKEGQNFFSNQETQISLQIIQIDNLEQLKPIITKYYNKTPACAEEGEVRNNQMAEIVRCQFIILHRFVNLGGKITSKDVGQLYKHIIANILNLDQIFLTRLFRLIAQQIKHNPQSKLSIPALPLLANPSHINSQLISLLLMVYPSQQDQIYINYHLRSTNKGQNYRQGIQQKQLQVIYDPVHLMHMLKYYFYYEDLQILVKRSMKVEEVEDGEYQLDQNVKTNGELRDRQLQALSIGLDQGYVDICNIFLLKSHRIVENINLKAALQLLKSVLTAKNQQKYEPKQLQAIIVKLMAVAANKPQDMLQLTAQQQLQQNELYKQTIQIVTIILTKQKQYLNKEQVIDLIMKLFVSGSQQWKVAYKQYSVQQLFNVIVCYKGCRDYLLTNRQIKLDQSNDLLITMLVNFRQQVQESPQSDHKHIFYICYFADSYNCTQYVNSPAIQKYLLELKDRKSVNAVSMKIIEDILHKFRNS